MMRVALALLLVCGSAQAQVQIVQPVKLAAFRNALPSTEKDIYQNYFNDPTTLFYSSVEMPKAYQYATSGLLVGGRDGTNPRTTFHWVGRNISGNPQEKSKGHGRGGNVFSEFPWKFPGGTDFAEGSTGTFKMMTLPKQDDGKPWPVVAWQETVRGSRQGPYVRYSWSFPKGTMFFEVLYLKDSSDVLHIYEIRIRKVEQDYHDIDLLRPFPEAKDLANRLAEIDAAKYANEIAELRATKTLPVIQVADTQHPTKKAFDVQAALDPLPHFDEQIAAYLLDSTPFKSARGATWREDAAGVCDAFAPTTDQPFSIVPQNYLGTIVGTDTTSCARCHDSVGKNADVFDRRRDWYGEGGAANIFTAHPIAPSSISLENSMLPVRLRPEFVESGMAEWFDKSKHPLSMYPVFK